MPWYDPRTWDESDWGTAVGTALAPGIGTGLGYMLGGVAESSRKAQEKIRALQGQIPQAPGTSAEVLGYMDQIRERAGQPLNESAYMPGLMEKVYEQLRQSGYAIGAQHVRQGATYYGQGDRQGPTYGAALKGSTEQQMALQKGTVDATLAARYAARQERAEEIDQLLKAAGFSKGVTDTNFDQEMRAFLAKQGLTQMEIDAEMDKWRMWFDLAGGALNLGTTAGASYAGGKAAAAGG